MSSTPKPPRTLPLMPLREVVLFPATISPLYVGREMSLKAVEAAYAYTDREIFLVLQKESSAEKIATDSDLCSVGIVARILQMLRLPDGTIKVLFEGKRRAAFSGYHEENGYGAATVEELTEIPGSNEERRALDNLLREQLTICSKTNRKFPPDSLDALLSIKNPESLADAIIARIAVDYHRKQEILEMLNVTERLTAIYECLSTEVAMADVEKKIRSRTKEQLEKNQREYYLTEQIHQIYKELGRGDDPHQEYEDFKKKAAATPMTDQARERIEAELNKFRSMSPMAPEYTIIRSYIEWVLALPWNVLSTKDVSLDEARKILDADHYGLKKPKERILEYLAVQKLAGNRKGAILCLVGPPGVGKTSLAKSIATATGREYVRLSLGGVRDEAEIRGHRRTYIGALPGKILQALRRVKTNNPLFCLDEIDKMASDYRGDPAAAMLEVLDPEQNNTFVDHYLDLDYDLSKVFFITTANSVSTIPEPLLDRMEVIELSSYLDTEKAHIARDYLIPRQTIENGLVEGSLSLTDEALDTVIHDYTSEAGVRSLERRIAKICRKTAVKLLEEYEKEHPVQAAEESGQDTKAVNGETAEAAGTGAEALSPSASQETVSSGEPGSDAQPAASEAASEDAAKTASPAPEVQEEQPVQKDDPAQAKKPAVKIPSEPVVIDAAQVKELLGVKTFRHDEKEKNPAVGVCTGLAWTAHGGEILFVEVAIMPGTGKVDATGKLGDVMKESARAALTYVRSKAASFGLADDFDKKIDVHIHVPDGATPKDGPSAGITLTTAITSALLGIPVRNDIAMTGEISLRGRVLPIGGLREKLLGAKRAEIYTVLIPKDNVRDLEEVPEEVKEGMDIIPVEEATEVLVRALCASRNEIFSGEAKGLPTLQETLRRGYVEKKKRKAAPRKRTQTAAKKQ